MHHSINISEGKGLNPAGLNVSCALHILEQGKYCKSLREYLFVFLNTFTLIVPLLKSLSLTTRAVVVSGKRQQIFDLQNSHRKLILNL